MSATFKANGKTFKVVQIKISETTAASQYKKTSADLKKLWLECTNLENWAFKVDSNDRVIEGHPTEGTGHVMSGNYQFNIGKGTGSVDRLILKNRKYETEVKDDVIHIKVSALGDVVEDTKRRKPEK